VFLPGLGQKGAASSFQVMALLPLKFKQPLETHANKKQETLGEEAKKKEKEQT
jgi:hypothetical protein